MHLNMRYVFAIFLLAGFVGPGELLHVLL